MKIPNEDILLQNVQNSMDDLSSVTSWIVITFFFTTVQLYRRNREIEIGGFKIEPNSINSILQFVVVVQLVQMTWLLLRILGNIELIKIKTETLKTILVTHPWFFNPFSDFSYQFIGLINFYLLQVLIYFILLIRRSDVLVFKYTARENWFGILRIAFFLPVVLIVDRISNTLDLTDELMFDFSKWVGPGLLILVWFFRDVLFTVIARPNFNTYEEFDMRKKTKEDEYFRRQASGFAPSSPKLKTFLYPNQSTVSNTNNDKNFALFDEFERTHQGRSDHDAVTYQFINNSSWSGAQYIRQITKEWSKDFPVDRDFAARFRSKRNKEHKAAFFELVMFQWFQRSGFQVVFQGASVPNSPRRPDFTLQKDDVNVCIAECTLSAATDDDEGRERLQNQITDILESIPSPKWWVSIEFVKSSPNTIPKKVVAKFIETMINEEHREASFTHAGWQIDFSLFLKSINTQRTLGSVSGGAGGFINSERPLRSALNNKRAKNYGTMATPFVICVNSSDPFLDDVSIGQTLFAASPNDDAFFMCDGKPQNTGVSAVLIFKNLVAWNLHVVTPNLWHNPWAANPLSIEALPVDQVIHEIENTSLFRMNKKLIERKSFGSVLRIDSTYLDEPIERI